jgi:hypothetical protein
MRKVGQKEREKRGMIGYNETKTSRRRQDGG